MAIAAPTFAGEYQTGGDSILRTTKYGRKQLAITKILAAFTLFVVTFLVGITVHILILDAAFGTDCLKTSFQMRYSIINLPNINLGQFQIILAAAGLLSVLATVSCTLFLSAKCKDTLTVLLISIVVLLMPLFAYVAMGATWLLSLIHILSMETKFDGVITPLKIDISTGDVITPREIKYKFNLMLT